MAAATQERPAQAQELENEAGAAVGAMPPTEPESQQQPDPDEIMVEGSVQLDLFSALGGKIPTEATLALTGKAQIDGAFLKGERIKGTFEAVVRASGEKDKVDKKTGQVVSCKLSQSAELVDMQVDLTG